MTKSSPLPFPSLNALRTFAAVGTHLNLKRAADQLFVTPSAVSHQIRELETTLQTPLFLRVGKRLELTHAGRVLLPGLVRGFAQIETAVYAVPTEKPNNVLTVSTLSTFAMRWLIPHLAIFQAQHAGVEVRISTSVPVVDLESSSIDCAIRWGRGSWSGLVAEHLFTEQLAVVCSPTLPSKKNPLKKPSDLAQHILLYAVSRPDDWYTWRENARIPTTEPVAKRSFETRNFAIQAASDRCIWKDCSLGPPFKPFAPGS